MKYEDLEIEVGGSLDFVLKGEGARLLIDGPQKFYVYLRIVNDKYVAIEVDNSSSGEVTSTVDLSQFHKGDRIIVYAADNQSEISSAKVGYNVPDVDFSYNTRTIINR